MANASSLLTSSSLTLDGDCVVVPDGGRLPKRCIKCGSRHVGDPMKFAFTWNPHGLGMGKSVTTFAAVATNRRGRVWAYYCADHRPQVLRNCAVMLAISAGGFALAAYTFRSESGGLVGTGIMAGIGGLVLALVYIAMPPIILSCTRIEDGQLWIEPLKPAAKKSFADAVGPGGGPVATKSASG